jgi:hypothetical protein
MEFFDFDNMNHSGSDSESELDLNSDKPSDTESIEDSISWFDTVSETELAEAIAILEKAKREKQKKENQDHFAKFDYQKIPSS